MATVLQPLRDLLAESYTPYYQQLLHYLPVISTQTYVATILAICAVPAVALYFYESEQARLRAEEPKGCRKLGMRIESNLLNEFDKKFAEGFPPSTEETSAEWWRLKSMWIYPVKGCKGVELNRATTIATGMEYDRQFTFAQLKRPLPVDATAAEKEQSAHKWEFITPEQYPLLANVRTEMWIPDQSAESYTPHAEDVESEGVVVISFPFLEAGPMVRFGAWFMGKLPEKQFRVPFNPTPVQIEKAGYSYENMTIWKETVTALNLEIEIPDDLRYYLGISHKLGLFRIDASKQQSVPTEKQVTGFQDTYPLHIVNLATIRDIEAQMPKGAPRLSAQSFRANLIVTGPEAYHEDTWRKIKIGFYEYDIVSPSARCKVPNAGQLCGGRGMQMISISKESALRVGDEITVLEVAALEQVE